MKTRLKNQSAHPAAPVMTPAQLKAAGIAKPQTKQSQKKPTKDQQIAALKEDIRAMHDLLQVVCTMFTFPYHHSGFSRLSTQNCPASVRNTSGMAQEPDNDCDTEVATENDDDDYLPVTGQKRISKKSVDIGPRYIVFFL